MTQNRIQIIKQMALYVDQSAMYILKDEGLGEGTIRRHLLTPPPPPRGGFSLFQKRKEALGLSLKGIPGQTPTTIPTGVIHLARLPLHTSVYDFMIRGYNLTKKLFQISGI